MQSVQSGSAGRQGRDPRRQRQATVGADQIELGGDIITAVDGQTGHELRRPGQRRSRSKKPGDKVTITLLRGGSKHAT